ncbi:MAG: diphosphomevalonate decarboxylase [Sediminicola sp.]
MTEKDFVPSDYKNGVLEGRFTWKAPSNIALVKYWGKDKEQVPANPSISLTLNNCATTTTVTFSKLGGSNENPSFDFFLDGNPKPDFKPKITTFFQRIGPYLPFLEKYHIKIETSNSFPHSSGIASSASGMAALALCLMGMEKKLDPGMQEAHFYQKASFLARLGSGSACRSIKGSLVQWGRHLDTVGSSNLYGVEYPYEVHPLFSELQDTILLVDKGSKQVSSSLGHQLMNGHPFAERRFLQAHQNLTELRTVLADGNVQRFFEIVEGEALALHAMMMTSSPYFILMKPNTLEIINRIWAFRERTGGQLCFTLDAGANVHLLYPAVEKENIGSFIERELAMFCENGHYINDNVGSGAVQLD